MPVLIYQHPKEYENKTYRLETIVTRFSENKIVDKVSYVRIVEVHFFGRKGDFFSYQLLTMNYDFSNRDNNDTVFARRLSYVFDELDVLVDINGNLTKIENIEHLQGRWHAIHQKLAKDYQGTAAESHFETMDNTLNDESLLLDFLNGKQMFGLLFNGQMGVHIDNFERIFQSVSRIEKEHCILSDHKNKVCTEIMSVDQPEPYTGKFIYENNQLVDVLIETRNDYLQKQFCALWIS